MGIASSRTTDTGVFIKPTAETGWKEISLLQKGRERSSPPLNLMFLISRTRCFAFFILICFSKIPASAATIRAQILRSAYYLTTITTTTIKQPIVYEQRLITALLHFPVCPVNLDIPSQQKGPGHYRSSRYNFKTDIHSSDTRSFRFAPRWRRATRGNTMDTIIVRAPQQMDLD